MVDVFELVPILKKLPLTVECITTWTNWLAVGTKEGHILGYYIHPKTSKFAESERFEPELKNTARGVSKKPIVQIAVSPEFKLLFSLTDGDILVHNLESFAFSESLSIRSRMLTLFAIGITPAETPHRQLKICIAEKKKIVYYLLATKTNLSSAKAKEKSWELIGEHLLNEPAKSLVFNQECDAIFIGLKREYLYLSLKNLNQMREIFPLGQIRSEPLMKGVNNGDVALCKDELTHFYSSQGQTSREYSITWGDIPLDFIYTFPYFVGLLSKMIEIRAIEDKSVFRMQTIIVHDNPKCIVCSEYIYIASGQFIWRLEPIAPHRQLKKVIGIKHFNLALQLTDLLEGTPGEKKGQIYHIKKLQAFSLFTQHDFQQSLEKYTEIDTDPIEVITLYPNLLPNTIRINRRHPAEPPPLNEAQLRRAMEVLPQYLMQQRNRYQTELKPGETEGPNCDMLQIIDTTLLKCYVQCNESLIGPLVRIKDNYLFLLECERVLKKHNKLNELVSLYNTKGEHQKALNLLLKCHNDASGPLQEINHTIEYLQKLGPNHLQLIFEFSQWVLEEIGEEGLRIFTGDVQDVESLDRHQVYDYLATKFPALVIPYVKAIMINWQEKGSKFHNDLVYHYKIEVLRLLEPYKRKRFPERPKAGQEPGRLGTLRRELLAFLENSLYYKPEKLISLFPLDDMFEERALLLGRLDRHQPALAIYAFVLKSYEMAEEYCEKYFASNGNIYLELMKMYLVPPSLEELGISSPFNVIVESNMKAALQLLSKYHSLIDTSQVLDLLPPETPLRDLQIFLTSVLEKKSKERRSNQVLKSLIFAQHIQVQRERIASESRSYVITEDSICEFCKKKLGDSAFACNPNGTIVHYYCWETELNKYEKSNPQINNFENI